MSYIKKTLTVEEDLILLKARHWFFWLRPFFTIAGIFALNLWVYLEDFFGWKFFFIILVFVCLPLMVYYFLKYKSVEYGVTTKRVLLKVGFLRANTDELRNERIENIQIDQSIMGRIFSYGNLEFKGTGGTAVIFKMIHNPITTKKTIERIIFKT